MERVKKLIFSQKVAPYVFVVPFILSFAFFWIYPMFSTVTMSFQSILPGEVEWVGLSNYTKLLKDISCGHSQLTKRKENIITYDFL